MPSPRRVKVLAIAVAITVLLILYFSGDARRHRNAEFYRRTVVAMDAAKARGATEQEVQAVLKEAQDTGSKSTHQADMKPANAVPEAANEKTAVGSGSTMKEPVEPGSERKYSIPESSEDEKSVAGRKSMKLEKTGSDDEKVLDGAKEKTATESKPRDAEAETELNAILKRSPIIIFSKSYCPYSRRAKSLLLETYTISPSPFVVELDLYDSEHKLSDDTDSTSQKFSHPDDAAANLPLGKRLQNLLAENTGRNTVPNILVNGISIGGSDDIAAMDRNGDLANKIKSLGGKRIVKVDRKQAVQG